MIGVASEEDIFVHPAQDIIDLTGDEKTENARLANAFVLTPVKKHVCSLFLRFHLLLRDRIVLQSSIGLHLR